MAALKDPEQARAALNLANDVRLHIAQFKRDLAGTNYIAALVVVIEAIETRHDDQLLGAAKVRHVLMAVPHLGETKVAKIMHLAEIHRYDKRLRDLTARQRGLLVNALEQMSWRRQR